MLRLKPLLYCSHSICPLCLVHCLCLFLNSKHLSCSYRISHSVQKKHKEEWELCDVGERARRTRKIDDALLDRTWLRFDCDHHELFFVVVTILRVFTDFSTPRFLCLVPTLFISSALFVCLLLLDYFSSR